MVKKHSPPSRVLSEGGVWLESIPLRLAFRAREGVVVWLGNIPLRLAFEAREGCGWKASPLRLALRAREGVVVWLGNIPLRLTFRVREGQPYLKKLSEQIE